MSQALAHYQPSGILEDSLFSRENAEHYMDLAAKIANSALVPKQYIGKPTDIFIAWAQGYKLGMSPEQSLQSISVINGIPCVWGDAMLAICMNHPDFIDIIEEPIIESEIIVGYKCTVKRRNMADHTEIYTVKMAKRAGLLNKHGSWTTNPERMYQLRARAFALRNKFPDALKGIKSAEEVQDYIETTYTVDGNESASHTELLKNDYMKKKGETHDTADVVGAPSVDHIHEIESNQEASNENNVSQSLGVSGEEKTKDQLSSNPLSKLSDEQLDLITSLMKEKGFSSERKQKALEYYEVESIEDMPSDLAVHFIAQLNKL